MCFLPPRLLFSLAVAENIELRILWAMQLPARPSPHRDKPFGFSTSQSAPPPQRCQCANPRNLGIYDSIKHLQGKSFLGYLVDLQKAYGVLKYVMKEEIHPRARESKKLLGAPKDRGRALPGTVESMHPH